MEKEYFFVYGTLLKSSDHPMARTLNSYTKPVGPASVKGRLYKISWFPGLVYNPDYIDQVHGELYEIENKEALFNILDEYEGVGEQFSQPNEYIRKKIPVQLNEQEFLTWAYVYNWPVNESSRISSGRFI